MIPFSALPPTMQTQITRAIDVERALLMLDATLPHPPSREVFTEECRRANLTTRVEITPSEVAQRLIHEWATTP